MHYLMMLAVEAESETDARQSAEEFLSSYEGEVWDWYEIGGRWGGYLGGKDVACAADAADVMRERAARGVADRSEQIRSLRAQLSGPGPGDPEHMCDMLAKSAAAFQDLMTCSDPGDDRFAMVGYQLVSLGKLVAGYMCSDSVFYDTCGYTGRLEYFFERIESDPEQQWLVVVDLHN